MKITTETSPASLRVKFQEIYGKPPNDKELAYFTKHYLQKKKEEDFDNKMIQASTRKGWKSRPFIPYFKGYGPVQEEK